MKTDLVVPSLPGKAVDRTTSLKPVLFFDGVCGLCNWAVDYLIARDSAAALRFAPLQSQFARAKLGDRAKHLDTVYLWYPSENHLALGQVFDRSDAILRALAIIGGFRGVVASSARVVPRFARDAVYNFVAAHRLQWFGEKETCRLPTPAERERFITD